MTKRKNKIPKEWEIDIVYIWCDSNNHEYIKNRKYYAQEYNINSYWSETRDHNEITHSIKSVRQNMKWVRNIFVCIPKWHRIINLNQKEQVLWIQLLDEFQIIYN